MQHITKIHTLKAPEIECKNIDRFRFCWKFGLFFMIFSLISDVNTPPFLEMSLSCDNLRCDGDGQLPSPRISVHVMNPPQNNWILYAQADVMEVSTWNLAK